MKIKELLKGNLKNMTLLELIEKISNDKYEKLMEEAENQLEVEMYTRISDISLQLRQRKYIENERY